MFHKNKLLALLSDFLSSQMEGSFDRVILIKDNYFCIPKIRTDEYLLLEGYPNSPFYIISQQSPVKRDTIKKQQIDQFQAQNFVIVYNSADLNNDQFLDEMKQYNMNFELSPTKLISRWLGGTHVLDESLNFLSVFIWDLKDFITTNRDKILRVKSLNNNMKFYRVVEIILKDNFTSLIEKGRILKLMNEKNSWKLFLIFQESNYIYRKIYNIIKENIGLDIELLNYIKGIILFEVDFKEILKIFLVAHFLDKLGENFISGINFSSFIDEFSGVHDDNKKDLIKSLNRTQIVVLSKIFENYLKNNESREKLCFIFSIIKILGAVIVNNTNLKEITIEMPSHRDLNNYEKVIKLSKIEYFYYLPLKISELFYEFFIVRISDLSHTLSSDDGGRIRKVYDNLQSGEMIKFFEGIDDNFHNIVNFYKYFYKLCYGLFDITDLVNVNTGFYGILDLQLVNFTWLPILVGLLQFLQMKMSFAKIRKVKEMNTEGKEIIDIGEEKKDKSPKAMPADPMQMMNKTMIYFMPVMIAFMVATLPSGVGLYMVISTMFGIGQQVVVNRNV